MSYLLDLLICIKEVDLERYEGLEYVPFIPHIQHHELEPIKEGIELTMEKTN